MPRSRRVPNAGSNTCASPSGATGTAGTGATAGCSGAGSTFGADRAVVPGIVNWSTATNGWSGTTIPVVEPWSGTSTDEAPWYVVPADHKWFARVVIGSVIISALEGLNLHFPVVDKTSLGEFKKVRKALEHDGKGGTKRAAKVVRRAAKGS